MSMGASKTTKIQVNGRTVTNREPSKKLNPLVKASLITTLKRNDIVIEEKASAGSTTMYIKDKSGKVLFSYDNAWDYGYYNIVVNGTMVAEMDWFENDDHTNQAQQDIFDIFNEVTKRYKAQQALTNADVMALKFLEESKQK